MINEPAGDDKVGDRRKQPGNWAKPAALAPGDDRDSHRRHADDVGEFPRASKIAIAVARSPRGNQ
jgi:hypothetical protein